MGKMTFPLHSKSSACLTAILCFSLITSLRAEASDLFKEVTQAAGINRASQTFGISWGDLNGDGWPDAYVSNHWNEPSLYINQQDGTFLESSLQHDLRKGNSDKHGSGWADFDNDGDQDLLTAPGGTNGTIPFFENIKGRLTIFDPLYTNLNWVHSDRMPLWFDQNNDGLLDLLITSVGKTEASAFFTQVRPKYFENNSLNAGFTNVIGSGSHLIKSETGISPHVLLDNGRAFSVSNTPWQEITSQIFSIPRGADDWVYGDIDDDGCMDLYAVKLGVLNQLRQTLADTRLELSTRTWINDLSGLSFMSNGQLSIVTGLSLGYESFRLGASSAQLAVQNHNLPIIIDPADPRLIGEPLIQLEDSALLYIWRDAALGQWHLRWGSSVRRRVIDFTIDSIDPIQNLQVVNVDLQYTPHANKFKKGDCAGHYVEVPSDINVVGPSISGVLADFDNDMDLDLYLTNNNPLDNPPDQYFENTGNGHFIEIAGASGAPGSNLGNGGSASAADYDMDGFLDLFVLNGRTDFVAAGKYQGPHQLYRNNGNTNNWIEIDLEGTYSNRDAIGAFVELFAGGKRQIRYQDNGVHTFSQNFKRLHFGLGQNEKVDKIIVTWPSGKMSTVANIRGNQLIRIREAKKQFVKGEAVNYAQRKAGIYLWKDFYDGPFKLRIIEDGSNTDTQISVISTAAPSNINGSNLESNDRIDVFPYGFQLTSNANIGEDGVDFTIPPDSQSMMSITVGGNESLHHLNLGQAEFSPLPEAWIFDASTIQPRPNFNWSTEIGTFMGRSLKGTSLEYRWSGAEMLHMNKLSILTSDNIQSAIPVSLEGADTLKYGNNWVEVNSETAIGYDGIDISVLPVSKVAFSVLQDGMFTPENLNKGHPPGSKPNAFWLPYPSYIGAAPVYDAWTEAGMFIWKGTDDVWHLRTTAGGGYSRLKGQILTSSPIKYLNMINIESSDVITQIDSNTIKFDAEVGGGWYDGIDFKLTAPGIVTIKDSVDADNINDFPVFVGNQKWPVLNFPVVLNEKTETRKWYGPQ